MIYPLAYTLLTLTTLTYALLDSLSRAYEPREVLSQLTGGSKLLSVLNFIVFITGSVNWVLRTMLFGELLTSESDALKAQMPIFVMELFFDAAEYSGAVIIKAIICGIAFNCSFLHIIALSRLDQVYVMTQGQELPTRRATVKALFWNRAFITLPIFLFHDVLFASFLCYLFQGTNEMFMVVCAFHFAVLAIKALSNLGLFLINAYELVFYGEDDTWENKIYYEKGYDIAASMLLALVHWALIVSMYYVSGLSFQKLPAAFMAFSAIYKKSMNLVRHVQSQKSLNNQLADASEEDLANDDTCIICMDDMLTSEQHAAEYNTSIPAGRVPKRLDCGHMLHRGCLKVWVGASDSPSDVVCPLCRRKVFGKSEKVEVVGEYGKVPRGWIEIALVRDGGEYRVGGGRLRRI